MTEEIKKTDAAGNDQSKKAKEPAKEAVSTKAANTVARSVYGSKMKKKGRPMREEKKDDFEQKILDLARVTRVMAGGKRMRFRACVAIGDKKGKIGVGLGKGADVTLAVNKAVNQAKKNLIDIPMIHDTIPHDVYHKFKAAKILFKPAAQGRGVIAGGVVRVIIELSGVKNITSKIIGTSNKLTNAKCTIEALKKLKRVEDNKNKKETVKKEVLKTENKTEKPKKTTKNEKDNK